MVDRVWFVWELSSGKSAFSTPLTTDNEKFPLKPGNLTSWGNGTSRGVLELMPQCFFDSFYNTIFLNWLCYKVFCAILY